MDLTSLDALGSEATAALAAAGDAAALESWRAAYLGKSGKATLALAELKNVPKDQKPAFGAKVNQLKAALEAAFKERAEAMGAGAAPKHSGPMIDLSEPGILGSSGLGRRHIISRVREELVEVFARMGFEVARGPELEDDEHNFVKLNIPADHPARDPIDNYYVDDPTKVERPRMIRSQTSTVQIRVIEAAVAEAKAAGDAEGVVGGLAAPIKIISPGRVYRPDTVDATHSFMFHQIEGLYLDRAVSMADLKTCLFQFAKAYFGVEAQVRLRPSYFPFTEPSAEVDLRVRLRPDAPLRWMELGGCGMVDPAVLEMCGVDPEIWTGFAFGFGIERLAMGKYGIPDIRMLFENDLRFLRQL